MASRPKRGDFLLAKTKHTRRTKAQFGCFGTFFILCTYIQLVLLEVLFFLQNSVSDASLAHWLESGGRCFIKGARTVYSQQWIQTGDVRSVHQTWTASRGHTHFMHQSDLLLNCCMCVEHSLFMSTLNRGENTVSLTHALVPSSSLSVALLWPHYVFRRLVKDFSSLFLTGFFKIGS